MINGKKSKNNSTGSTGGKSLEMILTRVYMCKGVRMRWHSLEKHLLHHVVQGAVQCGVIEQRAGRAQPAIEVHHLVVCIHIVVLCDLSDPSNHHALQDPAHATEQTTNKHRLSKNTKSKT